MRVSHILSREPVDRPFLPPPIWALLRQLQSFWASYRWLVKGTVAIWCEQILNGGYSIKLKFMA